MRNNYSTLAIFTVYAIMLALFLGVRVNPADGLEVRFIDLYHHALAYLGLACNSIDDLRQIHAQSNPTLLLKLVVWLYGWLEVSLCRIIWFVCVCFYLFEVAVALRLGWVLTKRILPAMTFPLLMFAFQRVGLVYWTEFINPLTSAFGQVFLMWILAEFFAKRYVLAAFLIGILGIVHSSLYVLAGPLLFYGIFCSKKWSDRIIMSFLAVLPFVLMGLISPAKVGITTMIAELSPEEKDMWWTLLRVRVMHLFLHPLQFFDLCVLGFSTILTGRLIRSYFTCENRESSNVGPRIDLHIPYVSLALVLFWFLFYCLFVHNNSLMIGGILMPMRIEIVLALLLIIAPFLMLQSRDIPISLKIISLGLLVHFILGKGYFPNSNKFVIILLLVAIALDVFQRQKVMPEMRSSWKTSLVSVFGLSVLGAGFMSLNTSNFFKIEHLAAHLPILFLAQSIYGFLSIKLFRVGRDKILGILPVSLISMIGVTLLGLLILGLSKQTILYGYILTSIGLITIFILSFEISLSKRGGLWNRIHNTNYPPASIFVIFLLAFVFHFFVPIGQIAQNLACKATNKLADVGSYITENIGEDENILVHPSILVTYYTDRPCSIDLDLLQYPQYSPKLTSYVYDWLTSVTTTIDFQEAGKQRKTLNNSDFMPIALMSSIEFGKLKEAEIEALGKKYKSNFFCTFKTQELNFKILYTNDKYTLYQIN